MSRTTKKLRSGVLVLAAGAITALGWVAVRSWSTFESGNPRSEAAHPRSLDTGSRAVDQSGPLDESGREEPRLVVDMRSVRVEEPPNTEPGLPLAPSGSASEPTEQSSPSIESHEPFPYGRPAPDWVFEQKYAGYSPAQLADAKSSVEASYRLASRKAINERFDAGDFEILPAGESAGGPPGDDRIIAGRSTPDSTDQQVVRLSADQYPEVYELFYEYLWLATAR